MKEKLKRIWAEHKGVICFLGGWLLTSATCIGMAVVNGKNNDKSAMEQALAYKAGSYAGLSEQLWNGPEIVKIVKDPDNQRFNIEPYNP